jgi:signal transduction histidine kinase
MSSRLLVRITAPILAISGLLLTVGVFGAWYVQGQQRSVSDKLLWNLRSMRAAEEVEIAFREIGRQLNLFLLNNEQAHLDEIARLRRDTDSWFQECERKAVEPREKELMGRARRGYGPFYAKFEILARDVKHLPKEKQQQIVHGLEEMLFKEILPPVHEFLDVNEDQAEDNANENQDLAGLLVLGLLVLGICVAGAGLLTGYAIARGISRSLVQLSVPVRDAAGKLSAVVGPVTLSANWSLQELEGVLRQMADQIGTVIERLEQSQRAALHAEQLAAVGQLAAGMAHELRNPLMSMKILVQAAAEREDSAGVAGHDLTILEEEITRLERLIRTFLDFARPPRLEKHLVEVRPLIEQTLRLLSGRAAQQGVKMDCALPDSPVTVEADLGQIRQVVLNLLLNALDALPSGGTIWVQVEMKEDSAEEENWLLIRVIDNGPGLPANLGQQIFEPFFSTKETGLGLGLSISQRIVEAHGGTLTAANRSEGGAAFTVRLPVSSVNERQAVLLPQVSRN